MALIPKGGNITNLAFSNDATLAFAQTKPEGKLRLLVCLWKINNLTSDNCIKNNQPVNTPTAAAQPMAGKSLNCKLDCSQAYHRLQIAD